MNNDVYRHMWQLMRRLQEAKIAHSLRHSRDDAIMIEANVPGERWEIEFVDYDDEVHVEIERFRSNGHIDDEAALEELFNKYSDKEQTPVTSDDSIARK